VYIVLVLGRCWWKAPSAFPPYITTQALILNGWFDSAPLLVEGAALFHPTCLSPYHQSVAGTQYVGWKSVAPSGNDGYQSPPSTQTVTEPKHVGRKSEAPSGNEGSPNINQYV